jgi:hypothetical protein
MASSHSQDVRARAGRGEHVLQDLGAARNERTLADLAADYRERPEVAACEPRRRVNSPSAAGWRERDLRRPVEAGRPGATVWRP